MTGIAADPSHPRYKSLLLRHLLEQAAEKGMLAASALIAHGRGEAFDYLLGEKTTPSALVATQQAAARLSSAKRPIISLNGNVVALAGKEMLLVADALGCAVEINIFYRTPERMAALLDHLQDIKQTLDLDVEILGANPDAKIPGLEGPRANCTNKGIFSSDVILVPLEDGDRCEALVAMGKFVIVVDLNPLSRSARMGDLTIVDELTRFADNLLTAIGENHTCEDIDNDTFLSDAHMHIVANATNR